MDGWTTMSSMSRMSNMSISSASNATGNNAPPTFTPQEDWTLISQGAEARIWKIPSFTVTNMNSTNKNKKRKGTDEESVASEEESLSPATSSNNTSTNRIAVAKERFTKKYRHAILDERLTKHRCRAEARILEKCWKHHHNKKQGNNNNSNNNNNCQMDVPAVYQIQGPVLYLEFIEGVTVRDYLLALHTDTINNNNSNHKDHENEQAEQMARNIGTTIGTLHSLGVVHGDLTTSNMMLRSANKDTASESNQNVSDSNTDTNTHPNSRKLTLIDFGLGKNTESAEERAVDLFVLERALLSTHPTLPDTFWSIVMEAYEQAAATTVSSSSSSHQKKGGCQATLTRLELVRQRGRKRECFG